MDLKRKNKNIKKKVRFQRQKDVKTDSVSNVSSMKGQMFGLENPTPRQDFDGEDALEGNTNLDIPEIEEDIIINKSRLRSGIDLYDLGKEYEGKAVSRKDLVEDDWMQYSDEEDSRNDLLDDLEEEDIIFDEDDNDSTFSENLDSQGDVLEKKLNDLEMEDKMMMFRKDAENEIEKAKHVQNQIALWETLMNLRIGLQQPLTFANRLPQSDSLPSFKLNDKKMEQKVEDVKEEVVGTLEQLFDLSHTLATEDGKWGPKMPFNLNIKEAKVEKIWKYLDESFKDSIEHSNNLIDKWNRKTQFSSGSSLISNKKFKVVNQSITSQIMSILENEDRLIKRTKMNRSDLKVIGKRKRSSDAGDKQFEIELDEEIFDDTDFYQVLLRDVVMSDANNTDAQLLLESSKQKTKKARRKKVDRRASKGRKVRYKVMEKLVNFMAPVEKYDDTFAVDELYSGLFGSKSSKN